MDIKFENKLDESKMVVTVSLKKRKKVSQPRVKVKWWDIERHVEENYTPPKTHDLGSCTHKYKVADNDSDRHLLEEWVFDLLPKEKPKAVKRASKRKK